MVVHLVMAQSFWSCSSANMLQVSAMLPSGIHRRLVSARQLEKERSSSLGSEGRLTIKAGEKIEENAKPCSKARCRASCRVQTQ